MKKDLFLRIVKEPLILKENNFTCFRKSGVGLEELMGENDQDFRCGGVTVQRKIPLHFKVTDDLRWTGINPRW